MKKSILISTLFFTFFNPLYAADLTCPPPEQAKNRTLITATQNPHDADYWYFTSDTFIHDGVDWNIAFGTFFPDVKSPEEALALGQAYFNQAPLVTKEPMAVVIRQNITLCDYIPNGRTYFISAISPPEQATSLNSLVGVPAKSR